MDALSARRFAAAAAVLALTGCVGGAPSPTTPETTAALVTPTPTAALPTRDPVPPTPCEGELVSVLGNHGMDVALEDPRGYVGCVIALERGTVPSDVKEYWLAGEPTLDVTMTMENRTRSSLPMPWSSPGLIVFSDDQLIERVNTLDTTVPERLAPGQVVTGTWSYVAGEDFTDIRIGWGPFVFWSIPDRTDPRVQDTGT